MTSQTAVLVEKRERVGWVTLNRPEALNALNAQLIQELVTATRDLDSDRSIGAIVITGSDRAFAAGADINELVSRTYADIYLDDPFSALEDLGRLRTPLIAAVSGLALGGGCELAMLCDIIVAADTASFGLPELTLGVIPGLGGTQRLPRAIGKYKAADMVLTGRRMSADEAERSGLVSRVVPAAELRATAGSIADTIASKSLPAVYAATGALQAAQETPLSEGLRVEKQGFFGTFALADRAEGMAAFQQKRAATFSHR